MGGSSSQTIGYWYHLGYHHGICKGPIDAFIEYRGGTKTAWKGALTASGVIQIDKPELWGGEKDQGGIVGPLRLMFGEAGQMPNSYLTGVFGNQTAAWRGMTTVAFEGGKYGAMNPYPQKPSYRVRAISKQWDNGACWYEATASITILEGETPVETWLPPAWLINYSFGSGGSAVPPRRGYLDESFAPLPDLYDLGDETGQLIYVVSRDRLLFQSLSNSIHGESSDGGNTLVENNFPVGGAIAADGGQLAFTSGFIAVPAGTGFIAGDNGGVWVRANSAGSAWVLRRPEGTYFSAAAALGSTLIVTGVAAVDIKARISDDGFVTSRWSIDDCIDPIVQTVTLIGNGAKVASCYTNGSGVTSVRSTSDGDSWVLAGTMPTADAGASSIAGLANGDQFMFCRGDGKSFYGALDSLTEGDCPTGIAQLAAGNGLITAITNTGNIYSTPTGAVWTLRYDSGGAGGGGIAYLPGSGTPPDVAGGRYCMNPAHMLVFAHTQQETGREPIETVNSASAMAAAGWFYAEGFGLCTTRRPEAESPAEFRRRIEKVSACSFSRSLADGLWHIDIANGIYDLESLPILTDDDVLDFKEVPTVLDDAINSVSVKYFDPERKESIITPPVRALGLVSEFGEIHQTYDYPEIPTGSIAVRVAQRELLSSCTPTRAFGLCTTRTPYGWRQNTYFRLQLPKRGIADMVCLVGDLQHGQLKSGAIKLQAVQDIYSLPSTVYTEVEHGVDTRPSQIPVPIVEQRAFEAPFINVVAALSRADLAALPGDVGFLVGVAADPADSVGFMMQAAPAGGTYDDAAIGDFCPTAVTTAAADKLTQSFTLAGGARLNAIAIGSPALWDDEICVVKAIDTGSGLISLGRACADTVPAKHAAGSRLFFYGDDAAADRTEYTDGETVAVRLLTNTGSQRLDPLLATPMSVTFDQRQLRPYPPAGLTINGETYPTAVAVQVSIDAKHRDRLLQADQLVDQTIASIGPEAGTTYTARFYADSVLQHTETGITAFPFIYTPPADCVMRVELESVRGGVTSLKMQAHEFPFYVVAFGGITDQVDAALLDEIGSPLLDETEGTPHGSGGGEGGGGGPVIQGGTVPLDPVNPGFESGLANWEEMPAYPVVSSTWAVISDPPNAYAGYKFLRWTGDSTPSVGGGPLETLKYRNLTEVDSPGTDLFIVTMRIHCKRPNTSGVGVTRGRVGIEKCDIDGNVISTVIAGAVGLYGSSLDSSWTEVSTFTDKVEGIHHFRAFGEAQGPEGSEVEFDFLEWNGTAPTP